MSLPSSSHSAICSIQHQDPFILHLGTTLKPLSFTQVPPWSSAPIDLSLCSVFYETLWVNKGAACDYAASLQVLGMS